MASHWHLQQECNDIIDRLEDMNLRGQEKTEKKRGQEKKRKKKKRPRRAPQEDRYFGRFHCKICNRMWESAFVFTRAGTKHVLYKQKCKTCESADAWYFPYALELITCSMCNCQPCECRCDLCDELTRPRFWKDPKTGQRCEDPRFEYCNCDEETYWILGDLNDEKKPHLSHLCGRCQSGRKCAFWQ